MNIAAIKGNLTRDPELKYMPSGAAVAEFTVAVNEVWIDKEGKKQERTHFIGCVAWGKTAENIAKHFSKGMPILVEGSLSQETWDDKESGKKREKTKIKVSGFDFCGGDRKEPAQQPKREHATVAASSDPDLDGPEDDIPF